MMSDQEIIDSVIIPHEGGKYTDHPMDRGGPTKWGITIPVLSKQLGRRVTAFDIENLSRDGASACYRDQFIRPFDLLTEPLRINAIDLGVNAGQPRSIIIVQQVVGAVVDGKLGPQTAAAAASREWNGLFTGARLWFYERIIQGDPTQMVFRNGWRRRALSFVDESRDVIRRLQVPGSLDPIFGFMGKAA